MKGALYESCEKKGLVSGLSSDHSRNRLMALAINSVFDATGLVTGGFSGIAILGEALDR